MFRSLVFVMLTLILSCTTIDSSTVTDDTNTLDTLDTIKADKTFKIPNSIGKYGNDKDYPKLSMWWPTSWEPQRQTAEELARYDYTAWGYWDDTTFLRKIKELNPHQKQFMSITITEVSWDEFNEDEDENIATALKQIPMEWFLLQVGSTLSQALDDTTTVIFLDSVQDSKRNILFKEGETVACGMESMRIKSVNLENNSITVERGFVRDATSHRANDPIASQITFWPESWVMNLTADCPKAKAYGSNRDAERWIDWAVDVLIPTKYPTSLDGYLEDRVEYEESWLVPEYAKSIQYNGSMAQFDNSWTAGLEEVLDKLRSSLNGKALIANSFGMYSHKLNGSIYESCPGNWSDTKEETYEDWVAGERPYVLGDEGYIHVSENGYQPNYSTVETYEYESMPDGEERTPFYDEGWYPDFQRMRFGLTTALMGDGYFSYEIATWGHGSLGLFWFDEYDNARQGQGYLGQPIGKYSTAKDFGNDGKVFRRDFDNGIAICNPTNKEVTIQLEKRYKHIKGIQVPTVNTGKVVDSVTLQPRDGIILLKI